MCKYKTLGYTGLFSLHIERPSYIVGQKARESSKTSMSTCDEAGHIQWVLENQQDVSPTITHRRMKCMCGSRGGGDRGSGPPLENHKNIGFLAILTRSLKIVKLPSQLSILASETPFKWCFAGGPKRAR